MMLQKKSLSGVALSLAFLSGCATGAPKIVSANATEITYRVKSDNQDAARDAAIEYCSTLNRQAKLRSVTPGSNNRSIIRFSCE